ncbi:MAG: helix-turn-helix transcriptional regulator [bacterium]|nr:helix-turn-helix transcriptional regulator [bacterium]
MKNSKKVKLMPYENLHRDFMKDPEFRKEFDDLKFEFDIIKAIIKARAKQDLTQRELANRIGIPQSALARFESGQANPTLFFLKKIVKGLGLKIIITTNQNLK